MSSFDAPLVAIVLADEVDAVVAAIISFAAREWVSSSDAPIVAIVLADEVDAVVAAMIS